MSIIQLGTITQLWQNVSDWATGVSSVKPKIQIDQSVLGVTNGVSIVGSLTNQVTFQNAVAVIGNGASLTVNGLKNLTVGIASAGGNTVRTIEFHGVDAVGNDNLISGVNKNGLATASSTINTGETWQIDITGLVSVYMKLTAITTGTVTVTGMVVS